MSSSRAYRDLSPLPPPAIDTKMGGEDSNNKGPTISEFRLQQTKIEEIASEIYIIKIAIELRLRD